MLKQIIIILILCAISSYSQQGWVQQQSGTSLKLTNLQFLNSSSGYVCGESGVILKTTNSGLNWIALTPVAINIKQIQFINQTTGYVSGDTTVYRTTDGGQSWTRVIGGQFGFGGYVHFVDVNTGYVVGSLSCYKTTNAGINWQMLATFGPGSTSCFLYQNDRNMFSSGCDVIMHFGGILSARILKSSNGGSSWTEPYYSPLDFSQRSVNDLSFPDTLNGFGVGWEGTANYLYRSTNNGNNWTKTTLPTRAYSISFVNSNTGWVVGLYGGINYTTNSGAAFITQTSGVNNVLNKIYMLNSLTGWIVGDVGLILSTANGGITSVSLINEIIPKSFSLSQNYPNPFNPKTVIRFQVAGDKFVTLKIFNALGKEVATLVNQQLQPGTYEADWDGTNYPSGVYFYQLSIGNEQLATKKMVFIK